MADFAEPRQRAFRPRQSKFEGWKRWNILRGSPSSRRILALDDIQEEAFRAGFKPIPSQMSVRLCEAIVSKWRESVK
jgi:hypothetical protein